MAVKKLDYDGLQTLVTVIEDYIRKHAGIPIGHEYFSVNPNIPEGSLPLFGGEYSRETYSDLWSWVQTQTGYLKTESEWQTLSTANNGNVPFYSDGDGSTTFRVPSLKCWVRGANGTISEVGSYLEAGLPNITGRSNARWNSGGYYAGFLSTGGAFYTEGNTGHNAAIGSGNNGGLISLLFDASRSSAIYGKSSTVQPQSIVGLWLVKAYGTVIETGSIDEKQYIDERLSNYLPLTGGTIDGQVLLKSPTGKTVGFQLTYNLDPTHIDYKKNLDIGWNWANRDGAGFYMRSSDWTEAGEAGSFGAYARDATQSCNLQGYPDGTLTWGGHEVERISAKGTNYIRYESGLQICWGEELKSVTLTQVNSTGIYYGTINITLPVSFHDTNYAVSASSKYSTGHCLASGCIQGSSLRINISVYDFYARSGNIRIVWKAIGRWK